MSIMTGYYVDKAKFCTSSQSCQIYGIHPLKSTQIRWNVLQNLDVEEMDKKVGTYGLERSKLHTRRQWRYFHVEYLHLELPSSFFKVTNYHNKFQDEHKVLGSCF